MSEHPKIPKFTATGKDHNGRYLKNQETGEKTNDKREAESLEIHDATEAKRHGTIQDWRVNK